MSTQAAEGEYRIEFSDPQWFATDHGHWRVDVARPVYRVYSRSGKVHAYAVGREQLAGLVQEPNARYVDEGVAFCVYVEGTQPPDVVPVYWLSSKPVGASLYTVSETERDRFLADSDAWDYRGVAWYAYTAEHRPPDARAVHRFWSPKYSAYVYTMDEQEREKLLKGPRPAWVYQGVAWYALPAWNP